MIGEKIRYLREGKRISIDDAAKKIGIESRLLMKYERGESLPDVLKCKRIAEVFGVSLDFLTLGENTSVEWSEKEQNVLGIVKVGENGQIILPQMARELCNIKTGDRLAVIEDAETGVKIVKLN